MGDLANGHDCDAFICAFADNIVQEHRSQFLDKTFRDKVRYYVAADDNWEVHLYAAIETGEIETEGDEVEAHFRVEDAPVFCPTSDDIIDQVMREFPALDEEEVERRLEQGREESEREGERAWQETLRATAAGGGNG